MPKVEPLRGGDSPTILLNNILDDAEDLESVVIMAVDENGHWVIAYSPIMMSDLTWYSKNLDYHIDALIEGNNLEMVQ